MAYADIYNAANDANFQGRCWVAAWKAAQDILVEAANTPDHARRVAWATQILRDQASITGRQLAMIVLQNVTIAANPGAAADADLQFQINSAMDQLLTLG